MAGNVPIKNPAFLFHPADFKSQLVSRHLEIMNQLEIFSQIGMHDEDNK